MFFKKATILLVLGVLGISQMLIAPVTINHAEAAIFEIHSLPFDYKNVYQVDHYVDDELIRNDTELKSGKNVKSVTLQAGKDYESTYEIDIYGTRYSNRFYEKENQCYISSSEVYITPQGGGSCALYVYYNNKLIKKSNEKTTLLSNLADGLYSISIINNNGIYGFSQDNVFYSYCYIVERHSTFFVDATPPDINVEYLSINDKDRKGAFTVSTIDSGSGLKAFYVKRPHSNIFDEIDGNTITISKPYPIGQYIFKAVDNTGNISEPYYVDFNPCLSGHTYTEQREEEPTCIEEGGILHICQYCNYTYLSNKKPPIGHSFFSEIVQNATCTEEGIRNNRCKVCGESYETIIPAKEHNYYITEEELQNGTINRLYLCIDCGDTYEQILNGQYEKITSYVEYLFNQYSPYMIWIFIATTGIWSVVMGVMVVVANKNEEKEKAKKMIVNYGIGLIVIFGILIACPYLINGIASLIT